MKKQIIYLGVAAIVIAVGAPFAISQPVVSSGDSKGNQLATGIYYYQVYRKKTGVKDPSALNNDQTFFIQELNTDYQIHAGDYLICTETKTVTDKDPNYKDAAKNSLNIPLKVNSVQIVAPLEKDSRQQLKILVVCD